MGCLSNGLELHICTYLNEDEEQTANKGDIPMTFQFPDDPQIDTLLKMTNNVVSNITQQLRGAY